MTVKDDVIIDGVEWWVVVKDTEGKNNNTVKDEVLLLSKGGYPEEGSGYAGCLNCWQEGSGTRDYMQEFVEDWTKLKDNVIVTGITTRTDVRTESSETTTPDRVFMLSEADYYGEIDGKDTSYSGDYTYDGKPLPLTSAMKTSFSSDWDGECLRSPSSGYGGDEGWWCLRMYDDSEVGPSISASSACYRAALWVNCTVMPD